MQLYNRLCMGQHQYGAVFFLHFVHFQKESLAIPTTDTAFFLDDGWGIPQNKTLTRNPKMPSYSMNIYPAQINTWNSIYLSRISNSTDT